MKEYIEREALAMEVLGLTIVDPAVAQYADAVLSRIQNAHAADVVECKRGEWREHEWAEEENDLLISNFECSVCLEWERKKSDFCPNCGADMRSHHDSLCDKEEEVEHETV